MVKGHLLLLLALLAFATLTHAADKPAQGFAMDNLVLYQPNDVLAERLPGGPDALAAYIKQLQGVLTEFFQTAKFPETLHTIVAVRPDFRVRVWFLSSTRPGNAEALTPLRQKLEAIKPVEVQGGPVAFVISGSIAGGDGKNPKAKKNYQPPVPREWMEAGKDLAPPVLVPDGYLDVVWPDKN